MIYFTNNESKQGKALQTILLVKDNMPKTFLLFHQ